VQVVVFASIDQLDDLAGLIATEDQQVCFVISARE